MIPIAVHASVPQLAMRLRTALEPFNRPPQALGRSRSQYARQSNESESLLEVRLELLLRTGTEAGTLSVLQALFSARVERNDRTADRFAWSIEGLDVVLSPEVPSCPRANLYALVTGRCSVRSGARHAPPFAGEYPGTLSGCDGAPTRRRTPKRRCHVRRCRVRRCRVRAPRSASLWQHDRVCSTGNIACLSVVTGSLFGPHLGSV